MRYWMLLPLLLAGACAEKQNVSSMGKFGGAPPSLIVTSDLRTAGGETLGEARVSQEPDGAWVSLTIKGLPQGDYPVHLHAAGRCEGPDFASAGPQLPQAGLPAISVGADGKGRMEALLAGLQLRGGAAALLGAQGAAIVVEAGPAGNSATRIACGVLAKAPAA